MGVDNHPGLEPGLLVGMSAGVADDAGPADPVVRVAVDVTVHPA